MKFNKHKKNCKSILDFKSTLRTFQEEKKPKAEVEDADDLEAMFRMDDDEVEQLV